MWRKWYALSKGIVKIYNGKLTLCVLSIREFAKKKKKKKIIIIIKHCSGYSSKTLNNNRKIFKIQDGHKSEAVNRRTDNTITKIERTNSGRQNRKRNKKNPTKIVGDFSCHGTEAVPAPLLAPDV